MRILLTSGFYRTATYLRAMTSFALNAQVNRA
jgi:hypothetical protein